MKVSGILAEKGLHAFDGEPRMHVGIEIARVWIIVADREKAHIYRKTSHGIQRIADIKIGDAKSKHEDTGTSSAAHQGYDVRSEKKHHNDNGFIRKLSAWLDLAAKEKVFDRLVLVAAPHTLGELRVTLSKDIYGHIAAEVNKDLMGLPEKEIEEHLTEVVWF